MKDLIQTLYADDKHLDLYMGVVDSMEAVTKEVGPDAWRELVTGNKEQADRIDRIVRGSGVHGLGVPETFGGMGGGFLGSTLATEILATHGIFSLDNMAPHFSRFPVLKHGTPEQIERWVLPNMSGEKQFCIMVTEPNAGTNTFKITTKARKSGNKWILNGQKTFITNAHNADYAMLVAKTDIDDPAALSLFIIDVKSPGISMQPLDIHVLPTDKQWTVFFDNVELPEDALIGEEGKGGMYMFDGLNPERFLTTSMVLGVSELALKVVSDYVKERAPFNKPTGSYQAVQHPLAKAKANTDAARLMLYHAVKKYDSGQDASAEASMAKYLGTTAAFEMCDAAIQFHGGSGLDESTGLMALYRVARTTRIVPVNNEMMLNHIAENVIGLPKSY